MPENLPDITFHTGPLTLAEIAAICRLQMDTRDIAALVDLLVWRSDLPAEHFLEMEMPRLEPILARLGEALRYAAAATEAGSNLSPDDADTDALN